MVYIVGWVLFVFFYFLWEIFFLSEELVIRGFSGFISLGWGVFAMIVIVVGFCFLVFFKMCFCGGSFLFCFFWVVRCLFGGVWLVFVRYFG